jgi:hypothetical protein
MQGDTYLICGYGPGDFAVVAEAPLPWSDDVETIDVWFGVLNRGIRIGEELYICATGGVESNGAEATELAGGVCFTCCFTHVRRHHVE